MRTLTALRRRNPLILSSDGVILGRMQTAAIERTSKAEVSSGAITFAGVLASMASPHEPDQAWSNDELADDVATIRYEQALRTHGRLRFDDRAPDAHEASVEESRGGAGIPERESAPDPKPLKTASITIRLSAPECAQVRKRAAEAGLTVSAYLRSCTLEVESLRAQVKDALSELRNSKVVSPEPCEEERTSSFGCVLPRLRRWFRQLRPRGQAAIRVNPVNPFAPVRS